MTDVHLTPTSYVVLGLVSRMQPVTSYEMKRRVGISIGHFWPFPHSQLYAEPTRLVQAVHRATERHRLLHTQGQYQMLIELINHQNHLADKLNHRIAFNTNHEIVYSWMKNLIRVDADGTHSYIKLVEHNAPLHLARNIGDFEKQFEDCKFMKRVFRSHLVNLYHVKKFIKDDYLLLMTDGIKVPVSEGKKEETLQLLRELGIEH